MREQRRYSTAFRRVIWSAVEHYCRTRGINGLAWEEIDRMIDLKAVAPEPVAQEALEAAQVAAIEIPLGVQSRQNYMQDQGRDAKQIEADNDEWDDAHGQEGVDPMLGDTQNNPNPDPPADSPNA